MDLSATLRGVTVRRAVREVVFVAVLFLAYKLGRVLVEGHVGAALTNAQNVWDFERLIHLPSEASLQAALLSHTFWVRVANCFYAYVHFPATAATLVWLYLRRPEIYLWFRRTLASVTGLALVIHALFPLAPPRMLTTAGILDTGHLYGPSVYGSPTTDTLSNQYAAMPSLHVGWALAVAIALIAATRSRRRWLWLAHPVMTLLVVVVTGNHYWLDAVAAVALLAVVLAVVTPLSRQPAPPLDPPGGPLPAPGRAPSPSASGSGPVPAPRPGEPALPARAPTSSTTPAPASSPSFEPSPALAGLAAIAMPSAVPILRGLDPGVVSPASVGGHPIVGWRLTEGPRPATGQRPDRSGDAAAGRPARDPAAGIPRQRTIVIAPPADSPHVPVTTCVPQARIDGNPLTRPPGGLATTRPGPAAPRSRDNRPR